MSSVWQAALTAHVRLVLHPRVLCLGVCDANDIRKLRANHLVAQFEFEISTSIRIANLLVHVSGARFQAALC